MPPQRFKRSNQAFQRLSLNGPFPHRDGRSNISRTRNGKRSRDYLQDEQAEHPPKVACLNGGNHSEREEPQQPTQPVANNSNLSQEQEFVDGPGHIIFIDERGKRCPAICFNKGLLSAVRHTADFRREVNKRKEAIQNTQLELERIKSSIQSPSMEKANRMVEEAIKNREEMEAEIPELVEARQRHEKLMRDNNWDKLRLDSSREMAQLLVERILRSGNLLETPPPKPQVPAEGTQNDAREPAPGPGNKADDVEMSDEPGYVLASPPTPLQPPTDTKEQTSPRQLALRAFRVAAEELTYWQQEFTFMQEDYADELAAERRYHREQYPDSHASTTQTDLDLQCLQKTQYATRKLIGAEEAYESAEQHAEDLGLGDVLADAQARYYGEVYDKFPERTEMSPSMFPVNRSRIEAWMASVPDSAGVIHGDAESVEVDGWDAKPVETFDSISEFASDMYRKKIDKWQELSGRLREGGAQDL